MKIDFAQVPDPQDFSPVPSGTYLCTLDRVEETVTKNGDTMWKLLFFVTEGDHKGHAIFDNMVFSTAAKPRVKHICKAFRLDTSGELELLPETICGQDVWLVVDVGEYETATGERRKVNRVQYNGYRPAVASGF